MESQIINTDKNKNTSVKIVEENDENRLTKCEKWLEQCSIDDDRSVYSDSDSSAFTESTRNSAMDSGFVFPNNEIAIGNRVLNKLNDTDGTKIIFSDTDPKYSNVNIYKSRKVHVGDVTYINGTAIITSVNSAFNDRLLPLTYDDLSDLDSIYLKRINWLAQPALGVKEYLKEPAKYVIIAHTATEEGFTQAENTLLVRLAQSYHIESRKWKDISYNFLIGSDGLAYEGRGWGVVGSHTNGYNKISVGISFVGCFLDHLPPKKSLEKAQALIELGVEKGFIAKDYRLLGHCQCKAIESPGKRLFKEIKTWKHWDASLQVPKSSFSVNNIQENSSTEDFIASNQP